MDLINAVNPDLVLFCGDIVDLHLRPVLEGDFADEFHRLTAPAFAVLGNHEYYGDVDGAEAFFEAAGIRLLKDASADFAGIRVIGRNDRSYPCRPALWEITDTTERFTLLLDHQPSHLEEAEEAGIDFQYPPRAGLAPLMDYGCPVREGMGPSRARKDPVLRELRAGHLGPENPRWNALGVLGAAHCKRVGPVRRG